MTIMGLLLTATVPTLGDMAASSRRTKYLSDLSSLFETARQYAVAKNTYVWVAFSDAGNNTTPLYAVAVASRDGLAHGYGPDDAWPGQTIDMATDANFTPVTRVLPLGSFKFDSDGVHFDNAAKFKVKAGGASQVILARSVVFSPAGEARIAPGIQGNITFSASATEGKLARVIDTVIVNGPTGFLTVQNGSAN